MAASSPKSSPKTGRIAAIVVLCVFGLFVMVQGSSSDAPAIPETNAPAEAGSGNPPPLVPIGSTPAADMVALVNGLNLGDEVLGWKVVNFFPTNEKIVWIEFGKDEVFFSVGISVKGKGNPPPPILTESYELGYGMVRPRGAPMAGSDMNQIAQEISTRIRQREKDVPKPAWL